MNKILIKLAGIGGVVAVMLLGFMFTKNYMVDPAKSLATQPGIGGPGITGDPGTSQYKIGCMDFKACNYDAQAKKPGDCKYSVYTQAGTKNGKPFYGPADSTQWPNISNETILEPVASTTCQTNGPCSVPVYLKSWTEENPGRHPFNETISFYSYMSPTDANSINGTSACREDKK